MTPLERAWERASEGSPFADDPIVARAFRLGWNARGEFIQDGRNGVEGAPLPVPPVIAGLSLIVAGALTLMVLMTPEILKSLSTTVLAVVVLTAVGFLDGRRWWRSEGRRDDAYRGKWR